MSMSQLGTPSQAVDGLSVVPQVQDKASVNPSGELDNEAPEVVTPEMLYQLMAEANEKLDTLLAMLSPMLESAQELMGAFSGSNGGGIGGMLGSVFGMRPVRTLSDPTTDEG